MDSRESVVLVNGLWLGDPALWLLARRLRRAGFQTFRFSYPSVRQDLRANAAQLHEFLARVPGTTVHLVGYSLGGLVIRALFRFHPGQRPGRVVLLGSPQQGSRAAVALSASGFGRRLIGRSLADLNAGTPQAWEWPAREIGAIDIADSFSLVEVPERSADMIVDALKRTKLRGRPVKARRERL
jgi:pimeloyl-ACP methyl ester carboxylesterase